MLKYGNRLPPLLNEDSEKKLFCNWWNIYLQLLVAISLDNYFPSFCLLTHLAVINIRARGALNKNILYKYPIIGNKQQQNKSYVVALNITHQARKTVQLLQCLVGTATEQPPSSVPRKRCSENMQQICRRTPMPKCNFNKVALQLYWNRTSAWVFSCKSAANFQNTFF